ncbi:MAG: 23S rRNA (guanosine(2251)-2'-O)-methyltransferase RlmB, partial [Lactococcus sp.]|nr:23S rRNA (guanosine(2251)-2'-O)-methyltransferase RlmB [Lactococcus sp.]
MKKNHEKNNQVNQDSQHDLAPANDTVYGVHAVTDSLMENLGNKLYIQDD